MRPNPLFKKLAVATLALSQAMAFAQASSPFEYKALVKTLVVSGPSSDGGQTTTPSTPAAPSTPTAPSTPAAAVRLSTTAVSFGSVATHTSATRQVVLTNTGTGDLSLTLAPAVTGDAAFTAGLTDCGSSVDAGQSCLTEVVFSPTTVGSQGGSLKFSSALATSPHLVTLSGTGYNPVSLRTSAIPSGKLNRVYTPFDFKTLLTVSNETTPDTSAATWSVDGTLPSGLNFNTSTAVLSGTPTSLTAYAGTPVTVKATYKSNMGERVYQIRVGDAVIDAVQLSSSNTTSCVVTTAGAAKCWGYSTSQALGLGVTQNMALTPAQVYGLTSGVSRVVTGVNHTCAILADTSVRCWGANANAELGLGAAGGAQNSPQVVPGLTGVTDLALGHDSSCALMADTTVKCWGSNGYGQLGQGVAGNKTSPTTVPNLTGVTKLSGSYRSFCAITGAGALKCWGYNGFNNLGIGNTTNQYAPVAIPGMDSGVTAADPAYWNTCALKGGEVHCWGNNQYKQVSQAATTSFSSPQLVPGLSGILKIAVGGNHVCAIRADSSVTCWGQNLYAQVGTGNKNTPIAPGGTVMNTSEGAVDVQTGGYGFYTCVLTPEQKVKCWGQGGNYGLGNGSSADQTSAVFVAD